MRRFTITPERIAGGRVAFDRGESRHLSRVLRLRSGDTVLAADGTGREYTVRLETVGEQATGTVLGVAARASESPVQITLLQSVPKGDKMESIVRASHRAGRRARRPGADDADRRHARGRPLARPRAALAAGRVGGRRSSAVVR